MRRPRPQRTSSVIHRPVPVVGAVFVLALSGCASQGPIVGQGGMRSIQVDEILGSGADDVLELIEELRPSWLLGAPIRDPSDPQATATPLVIINNVPAQPLFSLQFVGLDGVKEIRFLTATSARTRYRVNAPYGLIVVIRPPASP